MCARETIENTIGKQSSVHSTSVLIDNNQYLKTYYE